MDRWMSLTQQTPEPLRQMLEKIQPEQQREIREIRLRVGVETMIYAGGLYGLGKEGITDVDRSWKPDMEDCRRLLDALCGHAVYACEEQLKEGYLVLRGGFRVGVTGRVIQQNGKTAGMTDISMFCIRVPHEHTGICRKVLPGITCGVGVENTLILSRPGMGKTSLLRDLARELSQTYTVAVVDERSEIAACYQGKPQLDVGKADVLSNCHKGMGIPQLVRAMAPQIIITDEIGREGEMQILTDAAASGVTVIASAHAASLQEAKRRMLLRNLMETSLFTRYILLDGKPGKIWGIWDEKEKRIC